MTKFTQLDNTLQETSGRFFGLYTSDGKVYNAQLRKINPKKITLWDRNRKTLCTVSKRSVCGVAVDGFFDSF